MGTAREPAPVKLLMSLLAANVEYLAGVRPVLEQRWGPIDFASGLYTFEHTDYYAAEFGPGLQRQFVTFARLVSPGDLPAVKRDTNDLERAAAREGRRVINIDPGYLSLSKLVLATTKDHAHRLYLGQGIYGEVTLAYQRGRFRPWPWTYPDYAGSEYVALFMSIRERYRQQLKEEKTGEKGAA